ncbi:hypothetical protein AMTR_s00014p00232640 [Amborella trichopoda]|uniref:Uncharacterized protein n=1 Tax=Amborella trichopoda TaxID=13333 RepID=W1PMB3_AMBTC|nr:hypothetical protein AMTR_s00014p00232640 [Amborella trichopoda]
MARPKGLGSTSFVQRRESGGTSSRIEVATTPPVGSPVGSTVCSSLSLGDFLVTFAEEKNVETVDEVSSAGVETSKVPTPTISEVELREKPCSEIPSSE